MTLPPALLPIVRRLDSLTGRAPLSELHALLRNSTLSLRDVEDFVRFDAGRCCSTLLAADQWYEVLLIGWRAGQRSPIHDHVGSACAFKVLSGICSETVHGLAANGHVYPIENHTHDMGAIVAAQDTDTHETSNLQPAGQDLITFHIYSPPLKSMRTFYLLGKDSRQFPAAEHPKVTDGDGI
jgi:cysteine dioxygenase